MLYCRSNPAPPLSAFVSCLWYSEGLEGTHARERLLPNGESGIVFDLREQPVCIYDAEDTSKFELHAPAIFCGARTDCFVIDTSRQERVIGIQFRPGGAFPFLAMPASEVAEATYSLDDVWPRSTAELRDRLLSAASVAAMFQILERALLNRMEANLTLHPAVAFAARRLAGPAENVRISDVAERAGVSTRRLAELFRMQTGISPKAFHQVRRFQRVLQSLRRNRDQDGDEDWALLALGCGFYDQAHFIHEFRRFAGMTPGDYLKIATPHLNHVPLT
jgi:AraC-like DNA-binding protein